MEHDPKEILHSLAGSIHDLLSDKEIQRAKPDEISISTELAMRMGPYFRGWRVSPEWTRREEEEKRTAWNDDAGKEHLRKIRPDIIVHHMHTEENLLVVEVKRSGVKRGLEDDTLKLTLMTRQVSTNPDYHYGYAVGVHLILNIPESRVTGCDVYINGAVDKALTEALRQQLPG
ncbi:MAG: hypothetical protein ACTHNH_18350 [Mesorhizobium sp.]